MKLTLRVRYYLWLATFLFMSVLVSLLVLTSLQLYELVRYQSVLNENRSALAIYLLVGSVSLPVMLVVAWHITRQMLRPLRTVAETAQAITRGNLEERIAVPDADDELSMLVTTVNRAFDRYQDAVERIKRFSADASHQLRTPLTAIRSTGEIALQKERTPEEYRETLSSMLEDLQRLVYIVEQLLVLSRLDAREIRNRFGRVALHEVAHQVASRFEPLWEYKQIDLQVTSSIEGAFHGDAALMEEAIANLLDNAIRFTPEQGCIRLRVVEEGGTLVFRIEDSGPGISKHYRQQVFERFARAPGTDSPGAGLGLAIVADIINIHRGSIHVARGSLGGAMFEIRLPVC
ncbi:MAG: HAMP domain-containing protein [Spartobacteria bacterium]|nr:HAMP domain-containing protein [Spartobacteria bacterium]